MTEAEIQEIEKLVASGINLSLECRYCDIGCGTDDVRKAVASGWTHIDPDDGASWNYLGVCPDCAKELDPMNDPEEIAGIKANIREQERRDGER